MNDNEKIAAIESEFSAAELCKIEDIPMEDLLDRMADALGQDRVVFRKRYRDIKEGIL